MPSTRCTLTELAVMCGVGERTVQKWVQYRRIPKPGTDGRWTAEEAHQILDDWMKRQKAPRQPKRKREIF